MIPNGEKEERLPDAHEGMQPNPPEYPQKKKTKRTQILEQSLMQMKEGSPQYTAQQERLAAEKFNLPAKFVKVQKDGSIRIGTEVKKK